MIDNKKISEYLRQFAKERDWDQFHTPRNLAASISVESAELLELYQWSSGSSWIELNDLDLRSKCSQELADILIYLIRFADLAGINLEQAVFEKIEINRKKYPIDKSKGSDKKYDSFNVFDGHSNENSSNLLDEKIKTDIIIKYVASNESAQSIFHRSTCGWMRNVPLNSVIQFSNREDAIKTGFKPCKSCRP